MSLAGQDIEPYVVNFLNTAYETGPYQEVALFHLFNLQSNTQRLDFGDIHLIGVSGKDLAGWMALPYGTTLLSANEPAIFAVATDSQQRSPEDSAAWYRDITEQVQRLVRVLKYLQDGIVCVDFSLKFFQPSWVNDIRRAEILLGGTARTAYQGGTRPYRLDVAQIERLRRWFSFYTSPEVTDRLAKKNSFREGLIRAGDYYEANHERPDPVERLIALCIALEALFSQSETEGTLKMQLVASQILGEDAAGTLSAFEAIRQLCEKRNKIFHGNYGLEDYYQGRFVTHDQLDEWASCIRRAILKCLALYLDGESDRNKILSDLRNAVLNPAIRQSIRTVSDVERFIATGQIGRKFYRASLRSGQAE